MPRNLRGIAVLAALGLVVALNAVRAPQAPAPPVAPAGTTARAPSAIDAAFEAGRSDVWVEEEGVVERLLPDDRDGSRHQRFILRLASGRTVLVAHNIDLAERVAGLERGDTVRFRGEYEWNPQGGVVHWTHHDPSGRREGGWIEHRGRRIR